MERTPVESAVLKSVGYDATHRTLDVELRSGAVYRYFDVPPDVHHRLLAAESRGRAYDQEVKKPGFRFERIDD
jgi:hypothetical protein